MKKAFLGPLSFGLALLLFGSVNLYAGMGASEDRKRIGKAFNSGVINRETFIIQKLKSFYAPASVDRMFKSVSDIGTPEPNRELTHLLMEARKEYASFSPASRSFLDILFLRPDSRDHADVDLEGNEVDFYLPAPVQTFDPSVNDYPNIGGKIRFWYVAHSTPDAGGNVHTTTLAFVRNMAGVFEETIKRIVEMGYANPLDVGDAGMPLDENGGGDMYDVYIMDTGFNGSYGAVAQEDYAAGNMYLSYMMMDNDYDSSQFPGYSNPIDPMRATAAHEFHHAVQMHINGDASIWYMEATSTWMEEEIWDYVNDNRQYLEGFFTTPATPLDSAEDGYFYGTWIFNEFLEMNWDAEMIAAVWMGLDEEGNDDPLDSISREIAAKGSSFGNALALFRAKNYSKTGFYEEADAPEYVDVTIENNDSPFVLQGMDATIADQLAAVDHLACRYYKFVPGAASSQPLDLVITVDGTDNGEIGVIAVARKTDGSFEEFPLALDGAANQGSVTVRGFSSASEVILALVNYSKTAGDDSTEITFRARTAASTGAGNNESDSGGGGCFIGSLVR